MVRFGSFAVILCASISCNQRTAVPPATTSQPTTTSATTSEPSTSPTTDTGEPVDPCSIDDSPNEVEGITNCDSVWCEIAAGAFWMGSTQGGEDECPPRQVELPAFLIHRQEVTRGAYQVCVDDGICSPIPEDCDALFSTWPGEPEFFPVTCVSHDEAITYCEAQGGRLPTEAEWEKASRGEMGATWPWGSDAPNCNLANYRFVTWYCHEGLVSVGSYSFSFSSAFGTYDMAGNAWEWTADWYDAEYYRSAPDSAPEGPTDECRLAVGGAAEPCSARVIRGGAFNTTEGTIRSSARAFAEPALRQENIGFRCAADVP